MFNCGLISLYIPLCFLLISRPISLSRLEEPSLHSTMFSINQIIENQKKIMRMSLHSTMFSINQSTPAHSRELQSPLHSTMFSINRSRRRSRRFRMLLYIPLCFLLIRDVHAWRQRWDDPLHSTMFSINRLSRRRSSKWLYALHSTMFSINPALK